MSANADRGVAAPETMHSSDIDPQHVESRSVLAIRLQERTQFLQQHGEITRVARSAAGQGPAGSTAPAVRGGEWHRRDVLYHAGHYFALCSCGWVSGGLLTEADAALFVCEVELLLAESSERKRRLIQGAG